MLTGVENTRAIGVLSRGQLFREVAVLDDGHFAVDQTEVADALQIVRLGDGLARHLRLRLDVQADEERIDHFDQRIIDLEIADVLDAVLAHVGQRAAVLERAKAPAVAVRPERQAMFFRHRKAAVRQERWHLSLAGRRSLPTRAGQSSCSLQRPSACRRDCRGWS